MSSYYHSNSIRGQNTVIIITSFRRYKKLCENSLSHSHRASLKIFILLHSGQQRAYFYKFNNECIISSRMDCKQLFNNGIVNLIICLKIQLSIFLISLFLFSTLDLGERYFFFFMVKIILSYFSRLLLFSIFTSLYISYIFTKFENYS